MILGIDFSLTATGVCAITDGDAECLTIGSKPFPEWWRHPERVSAIAQGIHLFASERPAWVIESPSFGSKGQLDRLYSGWWMLVDEMIRVYGWEPPLKVAPTQVKKFATDRGNANKVTVALAVGRRYPDVAIKNDNEADALVLAAIGAAAYGEPFNGTLTKAQTEVVAAVVAGKEK